MMDFETLKVVRKDNGVVEVQLNRPKAGNAMNTKFWEEYAKCFQMLKFDSQCRVIVVSANGKHFTVGLDLKEQGQVSQLQDRGSKDVARKAWKNRAIILRYQDAFSAMEQCPQPVIVCAHGAVIGGGIDLLTASDIRLACEGAWFSIKEVDIGIAADVGTLQRLHHCMGNNSLARELAYTGRKFTAEEAKEAGFLSSIHATREAMLEHALKLADQIASKSPVAVAGTKINLNYSREHTISESLDYMAVWNMSMLQTEDMAKAAMASISKSEQPEFSKL